MNHCCSPPTDSPPLPYLYDAVRMPEQRLRIAFSTIESRVTAVDDKDNDKCARGGSSTTTTPPATKAEVRDEIFELSSVMGRVCEMFLSFPRDVPVVVNVVGSVDDDYDGGGEGTTHAASDQLLGEAFLRLFALSGKCGVDLRTCVLKKIELNGKKYPVELCKVSEKVTVSSSPFDVLAQSVLILTSLPCPISSSIFNPKGKSGKYTNYSDHTGITTTVGQSTINSPTKACTNDMEDDITVEGITLMIRNFANERQWYRYHTPRNIALAILGELGELAELFQWLGDGAHLAL
ncbi:hypothetical protein ACHAW5_000101 [Stephanodiscus triporus]|uniref:Uncharacterized protein n=1 Tax=Stephanodiscus triporus TaxID=2934178 RepID=A0ABD3P3I9_9STRA